MKAARGTPEWRARIAEGRRRAHEARRRREALALASLRDFERLGTVAPAIREHALDAEAEAAEWLAALGGDRVSPQRLALVRDAARAGVILRVLFAAMLRSGTFDPETV